ncbi:ABC transporter ATP-binding protein/permease [Streptomyces sp. LX-29]|uniref:ABC transporter ATP-binding protein n=1 Tax=Streptomyces sp. LX-29 TaxID=2900152 RepID=UPI00240E8166|nr:ABC transporter ATP-binding protein [Streptomyces sp. LX-29]WFB10372.1 ABC transporter ATP-binding protein/permease [Streptomyces sp. LX-29]
MRTGDDRPDAVEGREPAGPGMARRLGVVWALAARAAPGTLALYGTLTLATGALPVATAWLTKLVLDGLVGHASAGELMWLALGLAAAGTVSRVAPQLAQYLRAQLERAVALRAQDRLFAVVETFAGLRRFENPSFLDRLRFAQEAGRSAIPQAVDGALGVVGSSITIIGFVGSLYLLSPVMTAVVLLSGVLAVLVEVALSRRKARLLWQVQGAERREFFYSDLLADVRAAKEVRLFGIGAFLRGRMLTERRRTNAVKRAIDRRELCAHLALGALAAAVSGGGLLWAVSAARAGTLSVGDVTVFVAAAVGVQAALAMLAEDVAGAHQALEMFGHFAAVTTAGPDLPTPSAPRPLPPLRRGIELRNVWFRYSEDHPWVLRGVDLRIPHGSSVALVGLNGAGKSTLVKLVCRFYDPTEGQILWDGVDIREVDPVDLRRRIGAVFQDYMHYDMTAAECVGLGDLETMDDRPRIEAAARKAGIHRKLSDLPRGYDTMLSRVFFMESEKDDPDTGVVLSGGQLQRLALARAFLRDRRDLMILDEPAAGLDAEAEHEIHTSLRRHREGRTSLLISHRLGAVRDADLIVVLGEGRVAERGTHAALMAADEGYARLFRLQASGYQTPSAERDEPIFTGGS